MIKNSFLVLTTGGTIDGFVHHAASPVLRSVENYFRNYVGLLNSIKIKEICWKDSSDINFLDRVQIFIGILFSEFDRIIVTHGTNSMIKTQNVLFFLMRLLRLFKLKKIVVIVGAFYSLNDDQTDAKKNLEFAINSLNNLVAPGVYIAMSDSVFLTGTVKKNQIKNIFEEI